MPAEHPGHQPEARAPRPSRRATSYYNTFQTSCAATDAAPPSYAIAAPHPPLPSGRHAGELLPGYSCTVGAEAQLLLNLESISPLHPSSEGEWREVYAAVRGTIITFHRLKDGGPGKLLRSYTLQHAEVGLAPDAQHAVLVPQSRLAHLVPSAARRRAWQKDPHLFKAVPQTILRLRAETDQILLADSNEERISHFISTISAAIDISPAIDERSIPQQCTLPRRRRRQRVPTHGDLTDPALLAEQERIFRHMYPDFSSGARPELQRGTTADSPPGLTTHAREEEEVDLSMFREEFAAPAHARRAATTPGDERQPATSHTNFDSEGKWHPPHLRTPAQLQRYIRRCLPVLLANSVRASDIVIADGRRARINWRMELMEEWELQPPSYSAHNFENANGTELTRTQSHGSASGNALEESQLSSSSVLATEDQISPVETGLEHARLSEVFPADKASHNTTTTQRLTPDSKGLGAPHGAHVQGIAFCLKASYDDDESRSHHGHFQPMTPTPRGIDT